MLAAAGVPLYQVDAHNVVPVWMASPKREVGARTLRPKINKVFAEYCTSFPHFHGNDHLEEKLEKVAKGPLTLTLTLTLTTLRRLRSLLANGNNPIRTAHSGGYLRPPREVQR